MYKRGYLAKKYSGRIIYAINIRRIFWFLMLIVFSVGLVVTTFCVQRSFVPVVTVTAKATANREAVNIINGAVSELLSKNNITYNDLYTITRDEKNVVSSIQINAQNINVLKSQLATEINKKMELLQEKTLQIPLGSIFSSVMFTGWGPKIPVKINRAGYATVDFNSTFLSGGVNQTKHTVSAVVKTEISMILMKQTVTVNVETSVPVTETVIVGDVPSLYKN